VVIPPHRDLIKTSETVENKGFFALCSPYPFIRFHTVLPLLREIIRAKARAGKTDNTINTSVAIGKL
jgi:hypothetical protein